MENFMIAASEIAEQKKLVDRILASELFRKSGRLSGFLSFICKQHWCGDEKSIHEQRIGAEVFQRNPGYNVGDDSIVRSQARFLRQRLAEYFTNEGANENILLHIPKGSYIPIFEPRQAVVLPIVLGQEDPQVVVSNSHPRSRSSRFRWLIAGTAFSILFLLAITLYWTHNLTRVAQSTDTQNVNCFWNNLFGPQQRTLIVPADSSLVLIERLSGHSVPLQSYINKEFAKIPWHGNVELQEILAESQYTNIADLKLVAHLERIREVAASQLNVRYARDLSLSELKDGNSILIGSRVSNPWVSLFAPQIHFDVDYDWANHKNIVIYRGPDVHGDVRYDEEEVSGVRQSYGVLAYVTSLDGLGHTLLVEGTSKAGTEAAAEFLTSSAFAAILKNIGSDKDHVPNFEILLKTENLRGDSHNPAVLRWARLP